MALLLYITCHRSALGRSITGQYKATSFLLRNIYTRVGRRINVNCFHTRIFDFDLASKFSFWVRLEWTLTRHFRGNRISTTIPPFINRSYLHIFNRIHLYRLIKFNQQAYELFSSVPFGKISIVREVRVAVDLGICKYEYVLCTLRGASNYASKYKDKCLFIYSPSGWYLRKSFRLKFLCTSHLQMPRHSSGTTLESKANIFHHF